MAKKKSGKHSAPLRLITNDRRRPDDVRPTAEVVYEEDEQKKKESKRVMKAIYIAALALMAVIIVFALWQNRSSLSLDSIKTWIRLTTQGDITGDGFPVYITGNNVLAENFGGLNGNVVILSDTAVSCIDKTGLERHSHRHSFEEPAAKFQNGYALLYNLGGKSYAVDDASKEVISGKSDTDIYAVSVASDGTYALGTKGDDYTGEVDVYQKDGKKKYHYGFVEGSVSALSLNPSGTKAVVCTLDSRGGTMVTKITVLDFSSEQKLMEYEAEDNMIFDVNWNADGYVYFVGDKGLMYCKDDAFVFSSFEYEDKSLTSYHLDGQRAIVSCSAYEHAGACNVTIFDGENAPVELSFENRVSSISSFGGTVAVLSGKQVLAYDALTGVSLGKAETGTDTKAIVLADESTVYTKGIRDIGLIQLN